MLSVERPFEAWEEVQRQGQDLADRLAQGFTGLIHNHITPPSFSWPNPPTPKLFEVDFQSQNFMKPEFPLAVDNSAINGVTAIFDIGNRIGQAGVDFGACVNGVVQQFFRHLPVPFWHDENTGMSLGMGGNSPRTNMGIVLQEDLGSLAEKFKDYGLHKNDVMAVDESKEDETFGVAAKALKHLGRLQGTINVSSTYDSRTKKVESSLVARGELWRVEASQGSSTLGNENSSLFLVQLGPVLFVRDSTLLLPVHLSKQHLLWYGYDRKNGVHSLCPAVWSKHRRYKIGGVIPTANFAEHISFTNSDMLLSSQVSRRGHQSKQTDGNLGRKSFMDLQFPNGQVTYVSGEGLSTSGFLPLCGGLLQAQGQYPGEMKFSFSCKSKWGTRITPTLQWPDKSFALGLEQALAWKRYGLLVRPTVQVSVCPTVGGSCPGLQMELTHSVKEQVNLNLGCSLVADPSAFASVSVGRSKWNGNVGNAGVVLKVETPIGNVGCPSYSVQFNSGIEF